MKHIPSHINPLPKRMTILFVSRFFSIFLFSGERPPPSLLPFASFFALLFVFFAALGAKELTRIGFHTRKKKAK